MLVKASLLATLLWMLIFGIMYILLTVTGRLKSVSAEEKVICGIVLGIGVFFSVVAISLFG